MGNPVAEKIDALTYGGTAFIAAGTAIEFGAGYAAIVGGAIILALGYTAILLRLRIPRRIDS